jgi:hypothetical protein
VQDDALIGGGDAFGAAQPQGAPINPVEQGQVVTPLCVKTPRL